jgi:hypothetical protein
VFFVLAGVAFGNPKGFRVNVEALLYSSIVCAAYTTSAAGLAVWSAVRSRLRRPVWWVIGLLLTGPAYGAAIAHAWYPEASLRDHLFLGGLHGVLCALFGGLAVFAVAEAATKRHAEPGSKDGTKKQEASGNHS